MMIVIGKYDNHLTKIKVISLSCLADSHPPATITWYQLTPNKQVILVIMMIMMIWMIVAVMIVTDL